MSKVLPNETDLYGVTDEGLSQGRSLEDMANALFGAGIRILQYREKGKKDGERLEQCRLLRRVADAWNACFIVDDHLDLAVLSHADGIHVGQEDIPLRDVRALAGDMMVGVSAQTRAHVLAAQSGGADYVGIGPIFATQTKKDAGDPLGLEFLDWTAAHASVPFVCIGGIKASNIRTVVEHGGYCNVLMSDLLPYRDLKARVEEIRRLSKA